MRLLLASILALLAGPVVAQCGVASFYAEAHHGKRMANGQRFDQWAMTAAHPSLPFGTRVRVSAGKRSVVVTITDRGGFAKYGRVIDLSRAAFAKLAPTSQGLARVCLERL